MKVIGSTSVIPEQEQAERHLGDEDGLGKSEQLRDDLSGAAAPAIGDERRDGRDRARPDHQEGVDVVSGQQA
jgi:hypothetical protein